MAETVLDASVSQGSAIHFKQQKRSDYKPPDAVGILTPKVVAQIPPPIPDDHRFVRSCRKQSQIARGISLGAQVNQ